MDTVKTRGRFQIILNSDRFGIGLFCLYIFMSYMAHDIVIPSTFGSYTLYIFLGYSMLHMMLQKKIVWNAMSRWQLLFMGISLFSMLYSTERHIFSGEFYFLIINFVLILCLSQYKFDLTQVKKICWTYAASSALMVVSLMATGNMVDSTGRLGEDFLGNANQLALMLMMSVLYAIWLLIYQTDKNWKKVVLLLTIVANYYAMFLSGGRKFVIVPVIFLYILLLFKQDKKGRKHIIKYTVAIIAVVLVLFYLIMTVPVFYEVIGVRMESLFNLFTGDIANAGASAQIRDLMKEIAIEKWIESPIWGYGYDSFKDYNVTVTGYRMYSHNNFAELLYNLGLIGFGIYYWFYGKMAQLAWKGTNRIPQYARAFTIAAIISILIFEYGAVNYSTISTYIMLFLAFTIVQIPIESK